MKRVSVVILVCLLISIMDVSAAVTWTHEWNCNEFPENFLSGGVHVMKHNNNNSPTRSVSNGIYTVDTGDGGGTNNVGGESIEALTAGWTSSSNSTVQFRMKVDTAYSSDYACRFILADDATHQKEYIIRFYENKVDGQYSGQSASINTTAMTTYRIVYYVNQKIELWRQLGDGSWELLVTDTGSSYSGYSNDFFRLGSTSSSVDCKYELDYLYWENDTAESPTPVNNLWTRTWDCNEFPESFRMDGAQIMKHNNGGTPTRSVSNGTYIVDTGSGGGGESIETLLAGWNSISNSTVQFRMKVDTAYLSDYACRFILADDATHQKEYIIRFYENKVEAQYTGQTADIDTTVMTTYRLVYYTGQKIELWHQLGTGDWELLVTENGGSYSGYPNDFFRLGSTSGSVDGKYELDYLYWENGTADSPAPTNDLWNYAWDCDQFPEEFQGGGVLSWNNNGNPDRTISNGIFLVDTRDNEGGHNIQSASGIWSSDTNGTIELVMKIDDTYGGYAFRMIISDTDTASKEYIIMWYDDHVTGASGGTVSIDTTVMTTYRLLYYDGEKVELWKKLGTRNWVLLLTETGDSYNYSADFFRLGSTSGSVDGKYEIDRLYWENGTAEVPPPYYGTMVKLY